MPRVLFLFLNVINLESLMNLSVLNLQGFDAANKSLASIYIISVSHTLITQ